MFRRYTPGVPRSPSRTWSSLLVPPVEMVAGGNEDVRAIFVQFDQQTRRQRSILRLALVAIMVLAVISGTPRSEWTGQFALVAMYGVLSMVAAWMWVRHPQRARRLRALEPMMPVDIAAI